MKVCPKCKQQYDDDNNFCENCENEDGSGVSLIEVKKCPNCGKYIRADAKRCNSCGVNTTAFTKDTSNLDIHGNAVRGDLNVTSTVHHDETIIDNTVVHNEVTNNSTTNIIHNDESTATAKCSVCGKIIKRIEGYECTKCGNFVCPDCYDDSEKLCTRCSPFTNVQKNSKPLEKFVSELRMQNADTKNGQNFIELYIVPNNKNDIKEFLTYCSSQRDAQRSDDKKYISVVWNNKCQHLIEQGQAVFSDDISFMNYLKTHQERVSKFNSQLQQEIAKQRADAEKRKLAEEKRIETEKKKNEKEKKREANREKNAQRTKSIIKTLVFLLFVGGSIFGIRTCKNSESYLEKQAIKAEKKKPISERILEIQNSNPQHGIVIPKENITLEGYMKNYLEIVEDGIFTFSTTSHNSGYSICFSTKVRKTKSFLEFFEKQLQEFKLCNSIPPEKQVIIREDYVDGNFVGKNWCNEGVTGVLSDLKNRKKGEEFTISIIHDNNEKAELKNFLTNPPTTVILTSQPEFYYDINFWECAKKKIE